MACLRLETFLPLCLPLPLWPDRSVPLLNSRISVSTLRDAAGEYFRVVDFLAVVFLWAGAAFFLAASVLPMGEVLFFVVLRVPILLAVVVLRAVVFLAVVFLPVVLLTLLFFALLDFLFFATVAVAIINSPFEGQMAQSAALLLAAFES